MTENGREFLWTNDTRSQEALENLKGKLVKAPVLSHSDFSQTFILDSLQQILRGKSLLTNKDLRKTSELESEIPKEEVIIDSLA